MGFGYAPYGEMSIKMDKGDETQETYKSESCYRAHFFYERMENGISSLWEAGYTTAQVKSDAQSAFSTPLQTVNLYSLHYNLGITINKKRRLQFPLYAGIGAEYFSGEFKEDLLFSGTLKARVKFYISNTLGLYCGATYIGGITGEDEDNEDGNVKMKNHRYCAEFGIVFSL